MTNEQIQRLDNLRKEKEAAQIFKQALLTNDRYLKVGYQITILGHSAENCCNIPKIDVIPTLHSKLLNAVDEFIFEIDLQIREI